MARARPAHIGHGTDTDEGRAPGGGAEPTREPRGQDTSGAGRGVGLGVTTILGILLIAVPVIWAAVYIAQAGTSGLTSGFTFLVGIVLLAAVGVGVVLVRGLFQA
jgi:hypothetical protein